MRTQDKQKSLLLSLSEIHASVAQLGMLEIALKDELRNTLDCDKPCKESSGWYGASPARI